MVNQEMMDMKSTGSFPFILRGLKMEPLNFEFPFLRTAWHEMNFLTDYYPWLARVGSDTNLIME